jgi:hypothetical protein
MEGMKNVDFARRFQEACTETHLPTSMDALGKVFSVSGVMAWNYWNGEKLPSMRQAILMAKKLNVCVEWLLTGRGPKRPTDLIPGREIVDITDLPGDAKTIILSTVSIFRRVPSVEPNISNAA